MVVVVWFAGLESLDCFLTGDGLNARIGRGDRRLLHKPLGKLGANVCVSQTQLNGCEIVDVAIGGMEFETIDEEGETISCPLCCSVSNLMKMCDPSSRGLIATTASHDVPVSHKLVKSQSFSPTKREQVDVVVDDGDEICADESEVLMIDNLRSKMKRKVVLYLCDEDHRR
jgi:hypothetical protein